MTTPRLSADTITKGSGESFEAALVFDELIPSGETIASVGEPTITGPDETLTADAEAVNESAYTSPDDGTIYAVGQVVLYTLAGGTAGKRYTIRFLVTLSNGWIREGLQPVEILEA